MFSAVSGTPGSATTATPSMVDELRFSPQFRHETIDQLTAGSSQPTDTDGVGVKSRHRQEKHVDRLLTAHLQ
jgi:hypothetical protein